MTAVSPVTKTARQALVAEILARARVRSQDELAALLAERGIRVTQATLSRDLDELGAVRLRADRGALVYALPGGPGSRVGGHGPRPGDSPAGEAGTEPEPATAGGAGASALARTAPELLVSAESSANLVVARTPAGGAQLLASAIDHAGWLSVLGTVAGDDTVLVITRDPSGGDEVARDLIALAERRPGPEHGQPAGTAGRQRKEGNRS